MNKNQDIEKLFKEYNPAIEKRKFMEKLEPKLDVVDKINQEQQRMIRLYRLVSVISLIAGMLMGGGVMCLVLLHPIDWAALSRSVSWLRMSPPASLFVVRYANLFLYLFSGLIFIAGTLPMIYLKTNALTYGNGE